MTMPVLFIGHGSPMTIEQPQRLAEWQAWGASLPRPRAVLMISAHWETRPLMLGATDTQPLIYDFYGFPESYYQLSYPAPGAPELARRVGELLQEAGFHPLEVIRAATMHAAEALFEPKGKPIQFGVVRAGLLADLVIVDDSMSPQRCADVILEHFELFAKT